MARFIDKHKGLSRRTFLRGMTVAQAPVFLGLPPLVSMFNSSGTAYAAESGVSAPVQKRFVFWFNGNGIPERYWIPTETGANYDMTPCLSPLARIRNDVLVLSGLDNAGDRSGHSTSTSALISCTKYTGRGPSGHLSIRC